MNHVLFINGLAAPLLIHVSREHRFVAVLRTVDIPVKKQPLKSDRMIGMPQKIVRIDDATARLWILELNLFDQRGIRNASMIVTV
jgi:hypothetical protein